MLNGIIDSIFLVDILLSFRITYIDLLTGTEQKDSKGMAQEYLKTQFTVDILATMPFDSLAEMIMKGKKSAVFKMLGGLKLVRVFRLNRMIMYLRVTEEAKARLKLGKMIFFLLIYLHLYACGWWLLVLMD